MAEREHIQFHEPTFDSALGCYVLTGTIQIVARVAIKSLPKFAKEPPKDLARAKREIEDLFLKEFKRVVKEGFK